MKELQSFDYMYKQVTTALEFHWNRKRIQNPVKHLRWSVFAKCSILEV